MIYSFGSVNMDMVCQAPQLPQAGETLLGTDFQTVPGGRARIRPWRRHDWGHLRP